MCIEQITERNLEGVSGRGFKLMRKGRYYGREDCVASWYAGDEEPDLFFNSWSPQAMEYMDINSLFKHRTPIEGLYTPGYHIWELTPDIQATLETLDATDRGVYNKTVSALVQAAKRMGGVFVEVEWKDHIATGTDVMSWLAAGEAYPKLEWVFIKTYVAKFIKPIRIICEVYKGEKENK